MVAGTCLATGERAEPVRYRPALVMVDGAGTPGAPARRAGRSRWLGRILVATGLAMIPWLFMLGAELPSTAQVAHWWLAWIGLDVLEAAGLVTTGVLLVRRDGRVCLAAIVTATLLLIDAWFDVTTAVTGADQTTAIAMALGLELPLAVLCAVLAIRRYPRPRPAGDR